jgi:hypothetical protein
VMEALETRVTRESGAPLPLSATETGEAVEKGGVSVRSFVRRIVRAR